MTVQTPRPELLKVLLGRLQEVGGPRPDGHQRLNLPIRNSNFILLAELIILSKLFTELLELGHCDVSVD